MIFSKSEQRTILLFMLSIYNSSEKIDPKILNNIDLDVICELFDDIKKLRAKYEHSKENY